MLFNVSYERSGVCQVNLAEAKSLNAVHAWFAMYKPDARIMSVQEETNDHSKPGMPVISIPDDYLPYLRAAQDMSEILTREKGMTCTFYVMDKRYYSRLAYPQLSADNRGNPLFVGDWYVIVRCSNGALYYVNVTHDSVVTMCAEVFSFIQYK